MSKYIIRIEATDANEQFTEEWKEAYGDGIEGDGFVVIAQRGDGCHIAMHHVNIDGMSDAITKNDDLMSAAVLAKAKREISELQRHKDMGGFLEKLLGK